MRHKVSLLLCTKNFSYSCYAYQQHKTELLPALCQSACKDNNTHTLAHIHKFTWQHKHFTALAHIQICICFNFRYELSWVESIWNLINIKCWQPKLLADTQHLGSHTNRQSYVQHTNNAYFRFLLEFKCFGQHLKYFLLLYCKSLGLMFWLHSKAILFSVFVYTNVCMMYGKDINEFKHNLQKC